MTSAHSRKLLGVVAALVLAAGASTASANAAASLTKSQYIAKADAICASATAQVRKLGPGYPASKLARIGDKWLAIDRKALGEVKSLAAPPGDAATLKKIIGMADTAINKGLVAVISAAKAGSNSRYLATGRKFTALLNKAHAAARTYGFSDCSRW